MVKTFAAKLIVTFAGKAGDGGLLCLYPERRDSLNGGDFKSGYLEEKQEDPLSHQVYRL